MRSAPTSIDLGDRQAAAIAGVPATAGATEPAPASSQRRLKRDARSGAEKA